MPGKRICSYEFRTKSANKVSWHLRLYPKPITQSIGAVSPNNLRIPMVSPPGLHAIEINGHCPDFVIGFLTQGPAILDTFAFRALS